MPHLPRPEKKKAPAGWERGTKRKFYHSPVWKAYRKSELATSPLCAACYAAGTLTDCTIGGHLDHIIRIEDGGAELDPRNTWTLCRNHHARKSAMERHGLTLDSIGEDGAKIPTPAARREILKKLLA